MMPSPGPSPGRILSVCGKTVKRSGETHLVVKLSRMTTMLDIWRRDQRPVWDSVLLEAELQGDERRAAYARWILTEVLRGNSTEIPRPGLDIEGAVAQGKSPGLISPRSLVRVQPALLASEE